LGLTCAGATDEAVTAAITKKAERKATIMKTVTCAVNRPIGVLQNKAHAEGDSPTAWHLCSAYFADLRMPPAWKSATLIPEWFRGVNLLAPFPR
jgi:hypothetical protein